MSYTPPDADALDFSWVGAPNPYTPPVSDAANFSWVSGDVPAVTGEGAFTFDFLIEGEAVHGAVVSGTGEFTMDFLVEGTATHGVAGAGELTFDFLAAGVAVHPRYEARGVVKQGGVLVNRRVRVYDRDTGELISQGDTVAGAFRQHTGFAEAECYALAIHLDPGAVDWRPPVANRVITKLANDTA